MLKSLRQKFQDRFRRRRYQVVEQFLELDKNIGYILDLGGGPASFFASLFPRPQQVILLEIESHLAVQAKQAIPGLQVIIADGEHLPFGRNGISMTICNSVIEHISHPEQLAVEIERTSRRYFVQTPNGRFPLEPHAFFPIPLYNRIPWPNGRRWLCRLFRADFDYIESVRYLSANRLKQLFPQAVLERETFFGMAKSFYLIKK